MRTEHGTLDSETRHYAIIRRLINSQVHDVVETSDGSPPRPACIPPMRCACMTATSFAKDARRTANLELREYLYENLYYNPVVHKPNLRAIKLLERYSGIILSTRRHRQPIARAH